MCDVIVLSLRLPLEHPSNGAGHAPKPVNARLDSRSVFLPVNIIVINSLTGCDSPPSSLLTLGHPYGGQRAPVVLASRRLTPIMVSGRLCRDNTTRPEPSNLSMNVLPNCPNAASLEDFHALLWWRA